MAVTFRKILNASSMYRGKADHSTDESSANGTPVISMRVDQLELKPGETVELVAYDGSSQMQTYNAVSSSYEVTPRRSQNSYPELQPCMTVQTGGTYVRGVGLLIDTGLDFREKENLISCTTKEWGNPDITDEFKTAVKPTGTANNPRVVANWRVVPLLNDNALFSFTSDNTRTKQGHSYLGYELWTRGGSGYEYLTSLDTAMLKSGGTRTVASQTSDLNEIWHYSKTKAMQPNFPHVVIFNAPIPGRFSISYAWNSRVDRNGASYLNPKNDSHIYYGFSNKVGGSYGQRPYFNMNNYSGPDYYMVPLIPSVDSVQNTPWASAGNIGSIYSKVPSDLNHDDMGIELATSSGAFNDIAASNDKIWGGYGGPGGGYAAWSITTLGPPKDKASDAAPAGACYMPPYMALMNPLRDNGIVPRVDAFHSYNLVLIDPIDDGFGNRSYWQEIIFKQDHNRYWSSRAIEETTTSQYVDSSGDYSWTSKYSSDGGYRRGSPTIFYPTVTPEHGNCGYFSINAFTKNDVAYALPIYDFVRNSDEVMSLGVFSNANLNTMLWQPQRALGESWASPFIKREEIVNTEDKVLHDNELIDLSYMLNASVWDRFYLSTIPQDGLRDPYAGMRMRNPRHILTNVENDTSELFGDTMAFERSAAHIGVEGAFNVNSTSYEAWRAFLGGMLGTKKLTQLEEEYPENEDTSSPTNFYMPNPGNLNTVLKPQDVEKKVGYRDLGVGRNISEAEIDELAREVVAEVKRRAPFFSLADFINRRLMKYSDASGDEDLSYQSLMGTLSAAIARASEQQTGSKATIFNADYNFTKQNPSATDLLTMMRDTSRESIEQASMAPYGKYYRRSAGIPGAQLLQSQLLTAYAPFMTVRGDTFTIRAYGEYLNPLTGTSAKAYCEALVQRSAETVEPSDDIVKPLEPFGRKFKIVSFRWLTPAEL